MYCRKCGQRLEDGDAFCTNCGTPVPKEEIVARRTSAAAHNPEFKWNVREEFPEPRKRDTIDFNWGTDSEPAPRTPRPVETPYETATSRGFVTIPPSESRPQRTPAGSEPRNVRPPKAPAETMTYTLPSDRADTRVFSVPRDTIPTGSSVPYDTVPTGSSVPRDTVPAAPSFPDASPDPDEPLTLEDLFGPEDAEPEKEPTLRPEGPAPRNTMERELFRDIADADETARARRDDRFYTFTKKNEEFQRLLDREYERVRRNGTPVERPLRSETPLFGFDVVADSPERIPKDTVPAEQPVPPVREPEPVTPVSDRSPQAETAPLYEAPKARPEPTYQTKPEEIRTIWEEIKAEMERENAARIAKAAEEERVAKLEAEAERTETADRRVSESRNHPNVVSRKDLLSPAETAERNGSDRPAPAKTPSRPAGDPDDSTATALTKIWEDDEEDEPRRKGRFWLVLFLIIVVVMLLILAGNVIQNFWPDSGAASFAADAEEWLKNVWVDLKDFFGNLFK